MLREHWKTKKVHGLEYSQFSEQTPFLSGWLCLHNTETKTEWTRETSGKTEGVNQIYFLLENKLVCLV